MAKNLFWSKNRERPSLCLVVNYAGYWNNYSVRRILSVGNERRKTTCLAKTEETLWTSQCLIQMYNCQIKRIEILKRNFIKFWTPSFSCPLSCLRSYRWFEAFLYTMEMINASRFICSWTIAVCVTHGRIKQRLLCSLDTWSHELPFINTVPQAHRRKFYMHIDRPYRYRAVMFNSGQGRSITTLRQNNSDHITIDTKHGCATKAKLQL